MQDTNLSRHDLIRSLSTRLFPRTLGEILDWSDWLWVHCGTYSQALSNAVRYFLGDITIEITDDEKSGAEERDQVRTDLLDGYGLFDMLGQAGDEYVQWGNSFSTVAPASNRILHCSCGATFGARQASKLSYRQKAFYGICPVCKQQGRLENTERSDLGAPLQVTFWNPRLIDIDYCPTTGVANTTCIRPWSGRKRSPPKAPPSLPTAGWSFWKPWTRTVASRWTTNTSCTLSLRFLPLWKIPCRDGDCRCSFRSSRRW